MEAFVILMCLLVGGGFVRILWRDRAAIRARLLPNRAAPDCVVVMSRFDGRAVAERYQRIVQAKMTRIEAENTKLKAENDRLKIENAKLRTISAGQRTGVREFLERESSGKPPTRATITKILGKDTSLGYVVIGEELEKLKPERLTVAVPL